MSTLAPTTMRQVLDLDGRPIDKVPDVPDADQLAMLRHMLKLRALDQRRARLMVVW